MHAHIPFSFLLLFRTHAHPRSCFDSTCGYRAMLALTLFLRVRRCVLVSGAFAIYLEPWHADILPWLELKKNHGIEEERARDLFYGLWVNDLFMKRVEADENWSLFCPNEAPGLAETHSAEFEALYLKVTHIT